LKPAFESTETGDRHSGNAAFAFLQWRIREVCLTDYIMLVVGMLDDIRLRC
jgi:hypothetical protein